MKVYTKTGDKGQTGLIGGTRVPKNDIRLDAYGTVDELNSFIGLLSTYEMPHAHREFLLSIQNTLFIVGSYLATDSTKVHFHEASLLKSNHITDVENEIDKLDIQLPPLTAFILPGGSRAASICHICRTVARRAERRIYDLSALYDVDNQVLVYINRLSDYFFVFSRFLNKTSENEEILWKQFV